MHPAESHALRGLGECLGRLISRAAMTNTKNTTKNRRNLKSKGLSGPLGPGDTIPRAVVETVTLNGPGDVPLMFTDAGEIVQLEAAGAPVHARLTVPVNPETG